MNPASPSASATAAPSAASSSTTRTDAPRSPAWAGRSAGPAERRLRRARRRPAVRRRTTRRRPRLDFTVIRPPCSWTIAYATVSPRPVPLPDLLRREERIEDPRLHVFRHARSVVVHFEDDGVALRVVPGADDQRAAAVRAEHGLLGVDDEIEQHLLDLVRIGEDVRQAGGERLEDADVAQALLVASAAPASRERPG